MNINQTSIKITKLVFKSVSTKLSALPSPHSIKSALPQSSPHSYFQAASLHSHSIHHHASPTNPPSPRPTLGCARLATHLPHLRHPILGLQPQPVANRRHRCHIRAHRFNPAHPAAPPRAAVPAQRGDYRHQPFHAHQFRAWHLVCAAAAVFRHRVQIFVHGKRQAYLQPIAVWHCCRAVFWRRHDNAIARLSMGRLGRGCLFCCHRRHHAGAREHPTRMADWLVFAVLRRTSGLARLYSAPSYPRRNAVYGRVYLARVLSVRVLYAARPAHVAQQQKRANRHGGDDCVGGFSPAQIPTILHPVLRGLCLLHPARHLSILANAPANQLAQRHPNPFSGCLSHRHHRRSGHRRIQSQPSICKQPRHRL